MFNIREARMGGSSLIINFTNPFDAYHLLSQPFFYGCEFIAFSTYNIFNQLDYIFPTPDHMHYFARAPFAVSIPPEDEE
ncbi:Auxin-induced protein 5NG4 [Hordeum vulgare]|nr:Auxin-induced protein 5NG4 [Hordeum vulgare]